MAVVEAAAAVFVAPNQDLELRRYPVPKPAARHALLSLAFSGVCGTDIHITEGRLPAPPPFIPGHEFIGRITALGRGAETDGRGRKLREGQPVIACVALPCGTCFSCRHEETASCLNFGVTYLKDPGKAPHFFGGFAEVLHQPVATVVKIPANVSLDAAAVFPCAGPTAIRAFTYAGGLESGELVVVQGLGPVGLFAVAWAAAAGCEVVAIGSGKSPDRMQLARELGASQVIDYRATPPGDRVERVRQLAADLDRGDGADVVVEASGSPTAIPEGLDLVRTRGRYLVPGQYSLSGGVEIQPQLLTFRAIRVIGSGQYKLEDIETYLRFLSGHQDLQEVLRYRLQRFPVSRVNEALAAAAAGQAVKVVLAPEEIH